MRLTDNEIRDVTQYLEKGKPLPDKYRFLLFDDKREVELVWNGKTNEVCNAVLPFQIIEHVDEPRSETPKSKQDDFIVSYAKNYLAVHFKIDFKNASGELSNYYPDFFVKRNQNEIYIIETKGLPDLDVPLKLERLKQWCGDINQAQTKTRFDYVFVDEEDFHKYTPKCFAELLKLFKKYK